MLGFRVELLELILHLHQFAADAAEKPGRTSLPAQGTVTGIPCTDKAIPKYYRFSRTHCKTPGENTQEAYYDLQNETN